MNIAEEKEIAVTFPEDYHVKELAGQPAVFRVKLHEIKRKILPELDDEFAKDVSEFDTLEEYKQDLTSKLKERKRKEAEAARESAVVEKAAAAAEVDIPEVMIDNETERLVREFESRLRMQGMNLQLYCQVSGQDEAALRAQMRAEAEKRVRNDLVLEQIAKAENIDVSEEEIEEELNRLSQLYNRPADELKSLFSSNGYLDTLKTDLKIRKVVKFLVEHSKTA
jgi:trigger factor